MTKRNGTIVGGAVPLEAQRHLAAMLQAAMGDEQSKEMAKLISEGVDEELDRQGLVQAVFQDSLTPADAVYGAVGGALTYFAALEWLQTNISQLDSPIGAAVSVISGSLLGIAAGRTVEHSVLGKYAGVGRYAHLKDIVKMLEDTDGNLYGEMVTSAGKSVRNMRAEIIDSASGAAMEDLQGTLEEATTAMSESLDKKFESHASSMKKDMDDRDKSQIRVLKGALTEGLKEAREENTRTLNNALALLGAEVPEADASEAERDPKTGQFTRPRDQAANG